MVIGFVGFGEANSSIAQGLREEGLSEIICFDAMQADPRFGTRSPRKRIPAEQSRWRVLRWSVNRRTL